MEVGLAMSDSSYAAREQPTQEKLPLGHPYAGPGDCRFWVGDENGACYRSESAHQPTQEKPEDRR